ncbi:hypothetical protein [Streptacidiphilus albus]|uniref:hypothetical protein n=1 Tax=Streptacidiphilus albus TaxID=105425 RepID=UPI000B2FF840|nr:hypothetical protein [Streptacidiphilus albus]
MHLEELKAPPGGMGSGDGSMGKNDKKEPRKRHRPELSIRTGGVRLELDRLPRFPKRLGWILGLLIPGVIAAAKLIFHLHLTG